MKRIDYVAPRVVVIRMATESLLAGLSDTNITGPDGGTQPGSPDVENGGGTGPGAREDNGWNIWE